MKLSITTATTIALGVALSLSSANAFFDAPSSEELLAAYPALETTEREGNPLILCPFLRMLERSGRLDEVEQESGEQIIENRDLKRAANDFGCDTTTACGPVIDTVSAGQCLTEEFSLSNLNPFKPSVVDLERLWEAPPVSHECGFTFENGLGENGVSATRLESTLAKLLDRADDNDHLVYQDILDTKNEICAEEGVIISAPGLIEAQLIFAYLGGVERGYVEYDDVAGFLAIDSKMPQTKAARPISAPYLLLVNAN
ncbi:expressed unknown protein [Seminavis robusta]|uniref:Uncharacterized protein n=1 Tax=Seminavis robusta TaxID=568900 RepID=A0A9N8E0S3_9STRA|nr:expressed unknown protein [Seminavis robusta]|eukprot:Sro446_g144760.1 n/a (257) ;mRNA; f:57162-57932